ncbi:MAG TPA: DUF167 domain-containing protein [Pyrinomonadaceae bacterium]
MIQPAEKNNALVFTVKVVPRASKSEIVGSLDGALKIRIAAPPVDGAANAELVRLLSKTFGVSKSAIEILGGQSARTKQVKISGVEAEDFLKITGVAIS